MLNLVIILHRLSFGCYVYMQMSCHSILLFYHFYDICLYTLGDHCVLVLVDYHSFSQVSHITFFLSLVSQLLYSFYI